MVWECVLEVSSASEVENVLVLIGGMLEKLVAIVEDDRQFDSKLGSSYASRIRINPDKILKIDFIKGEHVNPPGGETIAIPETPVRKVTVIVESGGPISFSTATDPYIKSDLTAGIIVNSNEKSDVESPRPTIQRLNIVATALAIVRIILVV